MKKGWSKKVLILGFILIVATTMVFAQGQTQRREFIRFGGGSPGGTWFATVGGFATYLDQHSKDLNVTAIATGGSEDNNRQARVKELDTWLTHSLTALDLWTGTGEFEGDTPYQDFRLLSGVYENHHHFVTLASKTDINGLADLAGKAVIMGNVGSGGAINSENILKSIGVYDKIDVRYSDWDEAGRALQDGRVDALGASSAPLSAVTQVDAQRKIKLLAPTDEEFKKIIAAFPSYAKSVIPGGTYSTVPEDSNCISFIVFWAAQKDLSDDVVYEMLDIALNPNNLRDLSNIHVNLSTIGPYIDQMRTFPVPLHAGAVKYYRDHGIEVPDVLVPPEMK
ncbi:MAG: TAXI family TRAP transporter solute-binding subunit [Sphaerochaetaceae bacterium]